MGTLKTLNSQGDARISWDPAIPSEVAMAREVFGQWTGKNGHLAFSIGPDGGKGEQVGHFDPDAEEIILVPPMRGG